MASDHCAFISKTAQEAVSMSGEKRPASFGSSQLVKRARPDVNGNELATVNGGGSSALVKGVSLKKSLQ